MHNIFDPWFNGSPRSEMYRGWLLPELFPGQPLPLLGNWPQDDLEMYIGGPYAKHHYLKEPI